MRNVLLSPVRIDLRNQVCRSRPCLDVPCGAVAGCAVPCRAVRCGGGVCCGGAVRCGAVPSCPVPSCPVPCDGGVCCAVAGCAVAPVHSSLRCYWLRLGVVLGSSRRRPGGSSRSSAADIGVRSLYVGLHGAEGCHRRGGGSSSPVQAPPDAVCSIDWLSSGHVRAFPDLLVRVEPYARLERQC